MLYPKPEVTLTTVEYGPEPHKRRTTGVGGEKLSRQKFLKEQPTRTKFVPVSKFVTLTWYWNVNIYIKLIFFSPQLIGNYYVFWGGVLFGFVNVCSWETQDFSLVGRMDFYQKYTPSLQSTYF